MMGKNVLVADGEAIISEELMCIAASKGARIILVCNSNKKGALLQQRVCATAGTLRVDLIVADLTLVSEAQRVVTEMKALGCTQLDCIVSNMDGVDISPEPTFTSEGYETTFAKFLLAPFAMVTAAMPLLCAAAAPRVVLVSAGTHTHMHVYALACLAHMQASQCVRLRELHVWPLDRINVHDQLPTSGALRARWALYRG